MVILRRNIPTCLPLYNQANIGQRDCPCLQIVWQPSRRRTVVGVLGYPERNFVATEQIKTRTMLDINFIMRVVNYISIIQ